MNSKQYEELCRHFIAHTLNISTSQILSPRIPSPTRSNLKGYSNQIDLYWEAGDEISKILNIGNAKWRKDRNIEQGDILLLDKVKADVAAHKCFLFTNIGFTRGAIEAAKKYEIALHIVKPEFDCSSLSSTDTLQIQAQIQSLATNSQISIYEHIEVYKAYNFSETPAVTSHHRVMNTQKTKPSSPALNRIVQSSNAKAITSPSSRSSVIKSGPNFKKG